MEISTFAFSRVLADPEVGLVSRSGRSRRRIVSKDCWGEDKKKRGEGGAPVAKAD